MATRLKCFSSQHILNIILSVTSNICYFYQNHKLNNKWNKKLIDFLLYVQWGSELWRHSRSGSLQDGILSGLVMAIQNLDISGLWTPTVYCLYYIYQIWLQLLDNSKNIFKQGVINWKAYYYWYSIKSDTALIINPPLNFTSQLIVCQEPQYWVCPLFGWRSEYWMLLLDPNSPCMGFAYCHSVSTSLSFGFTNVINSESSLHWGSEYWGCLSTGCFPVWHSDGNNYSDIKSDNSLLIKSILNFTFKPKMWWGFGYRGRLLFGWCSNHQLLLVWNSSHGSTSSPGLVWCLDPYCMGPTLGGTIKDTVNSVHFVQVKSWTLKVGGKCWAFGPGYLALIVTPPQFNFFLVTSIRWGSEYQGCPSAGLLNIWQSDGNNHANIIHAYYTHKTQGKLLPFSISTKASNKIIAGNGRCVFWGVKCILCLKG